MKLKLAMAILLIGLFASLPQMAWAFEPGDGKFLRGRVMAVRGQLLDVVTPEGKVEVITDPETKFTVPGVTEPAVGEIRFGAYIVAQGEWNEEGAFSAKRVTVVPMQRAGVHAVHGRITAIEGTTLTVQTRCGEKRIFTDENTRFRIIGVEAPSVEDLSIGDPILAICSPIPTLGQRGHCHHLAKTVAVLPEEGLRRHTVRGWVVNIEDGTLVLATPMGEMRVTTTAETRFRVPGVKEPAIEDIKKVHHNVIAFGEWRVGTFVAKVVIAVPVLPRPRTVRGEVTAIEGSTLTVDTPRGEKTVMTNERTRFRMRGVESPTLADIKVGSKIVALGRPDGEGGLSARMVVIISNGKDQP